ncbi:MAG: metallophosphoesterase [Clostridia bacterium]|nr:metallophosphoesterase [Clostridia bacterium]
MYKLPKKRLAAAAEKKPVPPPATTDPIRVAEDVRLSAVLWGDPHVSDYLLSRTRNTHRAALDVANARDTLDVLTIVGDITENGKPSEYRMVLDDMDLMRDKVKHFVPASGNHDVRLRRNRGTVRRFADFCAQANPNLRLDKLYYTYTVSGYTFIVLGTVRGTFEEAVIDRAELYWFNNALKNATKDGKPAFVLLHQPLKLTHKLPDSWNSMDHKRGSVGAQSENLKNIMNKYRNVFLFTGHLHAGLGADNFEEIGAIHSVNIPSVGVMSGMGNDGYLAEGTGYIMEVRADSVRFRARDFARGEYLPRFDKEYKL